MKREDGNELKIGVSCKVVLIYSKLSFNSGDTSYKREIWMNSHQSNSMLYEINKDTRRDQINNNIISVV